MWRCAKGIYAIDGPLDDKMSLVLGFGFTFQHISWFKRGLGKRNSYKREL